MSKKSKALKRFTIKMRAEEVYILDAKSLDEAYEKIAYGEVEPVKKTYWGDDIVEEESNE